MEFETKAFLLLFSISHQLSRDLQLEARPDKSKLHKQTIRLSTPEESASCQTTFVNVNYILINTKVSLFVNVKAITYRKYLEDWKATLFSAKPTTPWHGKLEVAKML